MSKTISTAVDLDLPDSDQPELSWLDKLESGACSVDDLPPKLRARFETPIAKSLPLMSAPPTDGPYPYDGAIVFQGILVHVENEAGSERSGVDRHGNPWRVKMHHHYGEIPGTVGSDNDPVDVFLGTNPDAPIAYVLHQRLETGIHPLAYDEDKVMLGFDSRQAALEAYRMNFNRPVLEPGVTELSVQLLREKLADGELELGAIVKAAQGGVFVDQPRKPAIVIEVDPEVEARSTISKSKAIPPRPGTVAAAIEGGVYQRHELPEADRVALLAELAPMLQATAQELAKSEAHYDELLAGAKLGVLKALDAFPGARRWEPWVTSFAKSYALQADRWWHEQRDGRTQTIRVANGGQLQKSTIEDRAERFKAGSELSEDIRGAMIDYLRKAGRPGLQLVPSKTNPKVKRWQKTGGEVASEKPHPEVQARFEGLKAKAKAHGLTVQGNITPQHDHAAMDRIEARLHDHIKTMDSANVRPPMEAPTHDGKPNPDKVAAEKEQKATEKEKAKTDAKAAEEAKQPHGDALFTPQEMALPEVANQPTKDPDELFKMAEEAQKAQVEFLTGLAGKLGATVVRKDQGEEMDLDRAGPVVLIPGPKARKGRATEKVEGDYRGDWSRLLDVVRSSIAVDSVDQVHQTIDELRKAGVKFAKKPKDRFTKPTAAGYRDAMFNVTWPNGVIGEIQVHAKVILAVKNGVGHKLYEPVRTIEGRMAAEGRASYTPDEQKIVEEANQKASEAYNAAWESTQSYTPSRKSK